MWRRRRLRPVPDGSVLRRLRSARRLWRLVVHAAHVPAAEPRVRSGRRWLRWHLELRHVPDGSGLRSRRAGTLRLGWLHAAVVSDAGPVVRPRRRWLWEPADVRHVYGARFVRRWWNAGRVWTHVMPATHVHAGERSVWAHRRWVWWHGELWAVRGAVDLRRWRNSEPVRRHHVNRSAAAVESSLRPSFNAFHHPSSPASARCHGRA